MQYTRGQRHHEVVAKERETLEVIKADICQWLSDILKDSISPATFLERLDTGVLLCRLAKLIQEAAKKVKGSKVLIPSGAVKCNKLADHGSFSARDNTSNFISWCRELGVEEAVIFESDGLVLHKDEKRVILCLLDVARFAERVCVPPPQLVRMEREIEKLETTKLKYKPPNKSSVTETTLEKKITQKLKGCTCHTHPSNATSCGGGKFIISGGKLRSDKALYARLLSDCVMVRVGGGWDSLDHFLLEHDPCRIKKFVSDGSFQGHITVETRTSSSKRTQHCME